MLHNSKDRINPHNLYLNKLVGIIPLLCTLYQCS